MANRYWVGGSGTWDSSTTTNWSASSGGAGGASAPVTGDAAIFDAGSDSGTGFTVTLGTGAICNTLSISSLDFTMTLAGSANLTVSGTAATFPATNFTSTHTGTILMSATAGTFTGAGNTFNNLTFSSTAISAVAIAGANTFNNLTITSRASDGIANFLLLANQIVSGTLTLGASNTAVRRIFVRSDALGAQRTITLNGTLATLADVDFRDIKTAGTATNPWTGTRIGNALGNDATTITFDTPKTVYWNLAGSQNWSATGWATTNNGVPAANNFPLAQDTATFTEAGSAGTVTINANWNIGSIQMADGVSNRTTAFTLASGTTTPFFYGNITLFSSLTVTGTGRWYFYGQGVTQNITSAGVVHTAPWYVDSISGSVKLLDNTSVASPNQTFFLASGTLDLNSFTLTAPSVNTSFSTSRTIAQGTNGKIVLNYTAGNLTFWNAGTASNLFWTGTGYVEIAGNANIVRTITHGSTTGGAESNVANFKVTATLGSVTISTNSSVKDVDFTGTTASWTSAVCTIYGSLTIASGMTVTGGATTVTFGSASATQVLTSAGVTLDFPITKSGAGTLQLASATTTVGSSRQFALTGGTLNVNGKTLSVGTFSTTGTTARSITFGTSGTITVVGASWTASGSGLTTTGTTSTISMTSASPKTFTGGGFNYAATLNQGGAGALTIAGSNTLYDITATTLPSTITFTAGTTQTVTQFTGSGTSGNLLTLNSSSGGSAFTLSDASGTNNVSYCSITDSIATGGATWSSYTTNGNVDGGGNTGWVFNAPVAYTYSVSIKLRSMSQRGRF